MAIDNEGMCTKLNIINYDHTLNLVAITIGESNTEIKRSFDDFKRLNRSVTSIKTGFPAQSFKKLTCRGSWIKCGDGWDPVYTRSVGLIEAWLNEARDSFPDDFGDFINDEHQLYLKKRKLEQKDREATPKATVFHQ